MRIFLLLWVVAAACFCKLSNAQSAASPISYTLAGSTYTQNFDGLPNTGSFSLTGKGPLNLSAAPISAANLAGWQILMLSGNNTHAVFTPATGSATGNGMYSLGAAASNERALGSLSSSGGIYAMGMILTNHTGSVLNKITLSFTAEQWRKGGSGNKNTWSFCYKTGIITRIDQTGLLNEPALNFSSVINTPVAGSLNGNLPENQRLISYTMNHIVWKNGEQLLLRWDDADEAGNDDAVGLDNLSFTALLVSNAPSVISTGFTAVNTNTAKLLGTVTDNFANTVVSFEYDTTSLFTNPKNIPADIDSIPAGSGNTSFTGDLPGLLPGTHYYFRVKAVNSKGIAFGNPQDFITAINLPSIRTIGVTSVTDQSAIISGHVIASGGDTVTERGIVWSLNPGPTLSDTKVSAGSGTGLFSQVIGNLPQGSIIHAKTYAINTGGVAYGDSLRFITQTLITSFNAIAPLKTNRDSVQFRLQTAKNIEGLGAENFSVQMNGIAGAVINRVNGSNGVYTISVHTGTGSGKLGLRITNNSSLSVPLKNIPLEAAGEYLIDKTPPQIKELFIPNRTMKVGDTVTVVITTLPDKDIFSLINGSINEFPLAGFDKKNDSTYTARFVINHGGKDVAASADIPLMISLADSLGNTMIYQVPVQQSADLLDANKPSIRNIQYPVKGIYKAGDSLYFIFHFNETLILDSGTPTLALTIGNRSRAASYVSGSGTDSLVFRHIILSGDLDMDGIKTAGTITLNGSSIKDLAGNTAMVSFSNTDGTKEVLIDAVIPVVNSVTVPLAGEYKTGNILDFVVQYSRLVFVRQADSLPSIGINIGTKLKKAFYINGSGSASLLFRYAIEPDDVDTNGIRLSTLADPASLIKDIAGNKSATSLHEVGNTRGIRINTPAIQINGVNLPDAGLYKTGDTLLFLVSFTEKVFVSTGSNLPSLRITIGNTNWQAKYLEGSESNALLFGYVIQPGDEDMDGIRLNNTISLNGSKLKDAFGNDVPLTLKNPGPASGILIDAVAPKISEVSVAANTVYKAGDTLRSRVYFSEKVYLQTIVELPAIAITIGSKQQFLLYESGSGTDELSFRYIIQTGDLDKNGISSSSVIVLHNSLLTDSIGNTASVTFKTIRGFNSVKIDAVSPRFTVPGKESITVCENSEAITVSSALAITDAETGEILQWSIQQQPQAGWLSITSYTAGSNGKNIVPVGVSYQPFQGSSGKDSFLVEVTDSINITQKYIIIQVLPAIRNNQVTGSQITCSEQTPAPFQGSVPSGGDGHYQYVWETATVTDSLHFISAGGINDQPGYSPSSLKTNTWFRRRVQSGSCNNTSPAIRISVVKSGLWLGTVSSDWHTAGNWCMKLVPDTLTDVFIYPNTAVLPEIKDTASCRHLFIAGNTTLTINGMLELYGNLNAADRTIQATHGSILLRDSSSQLINGNIFEKNTLHQLIIQNTAGTSITNSLQITGNLLLNNGFINTHDQLIMAPGAVVAPSAAGTFIKGKASVHHFIEGGKRSFRLMGHPFAESIGLAMISKQMDITGANGTQHGFTTTATNQPSAFRFDAYYGNDSLGVDAGWLPFTHTDGLAENAWNRLTGTRLFFRGSMGQGLDDTPAGDGRNGTYLPSPLTLRLTGTLQTGEQEIHLPKYTYGTYHVISNPYLSNIETNAITRGSDVSPCYWLWHPKQGKQGGYTSYPFRNKQILPPFAAFITKANGNKSNQLLFTENTKSTDVYHDTIAAISLDDIFYVELRLETGSIFWDRFVLLCMDSARNYFDKQDAEKFYNSDVNFYSISAGERPLSIDARPVTNETSIPLGLQTNEPHSFTIRVAKVILPASNTLLLHDRYLDRWMRLETDSAYHFTTTSDTASYGDHRFEITSKKIADTLVSKPAITVHLGPNPAKDKLMVQFRSTETGNTSIRLLAYSGTLLKQLQLGLQKEVQVTIPIGDIGTGVYVLEIRCGNLFATKQFIKE